MISHRRPGWTLLESLLVLGLISLVGLMWIPKPSRRTARQEELQFFQDFHGMWLGAVYTTINQPNTSVSVALSVDRFDRYIVVFIVSGKQHKYPVRQLIIPKTLDFNGFRLVIHPNGVVAPHTIFFWSKTDNHQFRIITQMGWGLYRLEGV